MIIHGFQLLPDRIIPLEPPASTLDELTGRLSDGFYTTFTTLSGGTRVLGLASHLKRLYDPAKEFHLHPAVNERTLRRQIAELAKPNQPGESRTRLILTKDTGEMYLGILPFTPLPESIYREGVHVLTADIARHDPRIKGTDFITQSAEQRKLIRGDVFEILLAHHGEILEGMTSNFYAVNYVVARRSGANFATTTKQSGLNGRLLRRNPSTSLDEHSLRSGRPPRNDGILVTTQKGILLGVTRHVVLRLARGQGMDIEYRAPLIDEHFDEAFLTSSSRGVVPIVMIDGKPVGEGKPGAWTKALSLAYQAYVWERSEEIVES